MENGKNNINFENALSRLEEIADMMENKELSLEQSLEIFQEGMELASFCHRKLEEAEKRINVLVKNSEGQMVEKDFDIQEE
jgi:exodeoxyribonuclease VII small subunit